MLSTTGDNGSGVPTADILREVVMSDCPSDLYQHLSYGGALLGFGCGETVLQNMVNVGVSDTQCPHLLKGPQRVVKGWRPSRGHRV